MSINIGFITYMLIALLVLLFMSAMLIGVMIARQRRLLKDVTIIKRMIVRLIKMMEEAPVDEKERIEDTQEDMEIHSSPSAFVTKEAVADTHEVFVDKQAHDVKTIQTAPPLSCQKPYPIQALIVNASIHYNKSARVKFDKCETEEVIFELYSDYTVQPMGFYFNSFNTCAHFTSNDFLEVFDFFDTGGNQINPYNAVERIRLSEVHTPARAEYLKGDILLVRKGILTVEVR